MKNSQHDISLLLENMTLILMKQTGKTQDFIIRDLLKSKFYGDLTANIIDITQVTPEDAITRFEAEGVK
jgi:hypothetical protein